MDFYLNSFVIGIFNCIIYCLQRSFGTICRCSGSEQMSRRCYC